MHRVEIKPRPNFLEIIEKQGFLWHSAGGTPYWTEDAAYQFTSAQVDELERATYALNDMCLKAVDYALQHEEVLDSFEIYPWMRPIIRKSWVEQETTVCGRFDLSYDGKTPPKLLEYNADTPTGLVEQAVIQWGWLQDLMPNADQFNSTHERLIEAYGTVKSKHGPTVTMHFTSLPQEIALEDYITVNYLRDVATQAGIKTAYMPIESMGWHEATKTLRDADDNVIKHCTKLYPWEWMVEEDIGATLPKLTDVLFWEPPWKAILSNKALLVLLYEMFPTSPYLLKASYSESDFEDTFVFKPQFSREGANIQIVKNGRTLADTPGEYGETDNWIYQEFAPLPNFDGNYPVVGSWMVNGYATGIGIRESDSLVTGNLSRFVPHYFGKG